MDYEFKIGDEVITQNISDFLDNRKGTITGIGFTVHPYSCPYFIVTLKKPFDEKGSTSMLLPQFGMRKLTRTE